MELIKRKILLENSIDRTYNSPNYGTITATSFYLKVLLTQNIDNMGLFTDENYILNDGNNAIYPDYTILIDKLASSGITFPFMSGQTPTSISGITGTTDIVLRLTGATPNNYYSGIGLRISAATDSKIDDVKSYDMLLPYKIGFNMIVDDYINYSGVNISGVSRVVSLSEPNTYVFDTKDDMYLGTSGQTTGLLYNDYSAKTRNVIINDINKKISLTTVEYVGEGMNETNSSLSAITKEEYLFGITNIAKTESDVFVDRGATIVFDKHLKLSETKTLDELVKYGNGFYNIQK